MRAINHFIFAFCLLAAMHSAYGQNKNQARQLKTLSKEARFALDGEDYLGAWQLYRKILVLEPKNELAGVNAAFCIVKLNYSQDSAQVLAYNLSVSKLPDAKYYLAKLRHHEKRFDEGIALLEEYKKTDPKKRLMNDAETTYLLNQCVSAKTLMAKPHLSVIKNMGPAVNSPFDDYVPVIMPDESAMYFTSKRSGSLGNRKNGDNSYYEDVYVTQRTESGWKRAENTGFPINTDNNDACVALSPDGHRMIVYRTSPDGLTGDLYLTQMGTHGHWEPLQPMGSEINTEFIETSACFSNDTNEIYFSSNRPGGFGGKDLYRIRKFPNGHWAAPYNLGPSVNTPYDDDAPFLHPDGVTLFFSSKGHNTMGEFDVFKSVLAVDSNQFSKAENLGYPINDVGNDIFFVLSVDGQRGYYSSSKKETHGGTDIYQVDTRFGDNDLVVKQAYTYLDDLLGRAQVTLIDKESNEIVGNFLSHPNTGKFILVLNPLKAYKLIVEEEGYTTLETEIAPQLNEKAEKHLRYKLKKANAQ